MYVFFNKKIMRRTKMAQCEGCDLCQNMQCVFCMVCFSQ